MKTQLASLSVLSFSLVYPIQVKAGHPGGGGVGGHAPAAPGSHVSAPAPHFEAPHAAAAPHFEAPHMSSPAQHFQAPHAAAAPHSEAPRHSAPARHLEASRAIDAGPRVENRAFEPHQQALGGGNRAAEFSGHEEGRPIANAARFGRQEDRADNFAWRNRAMGAAGGLAAGGLEAKALSYGGEHNETLNGAAREAGRIPGPPSYANPRHSFAPEIGRGLALSPHAAPNLSYGKGARDIPRTGDARSGRPGAIDPGGYIRNARQASSTINPAYARQQLAHANNDYQQAAAFNARNIMGNRGSWPWHLPNYTAPWFGGSWQGNWNWEPNWFSGGGSNPYWGNGWNRGGGFFGFLSALSPWGCNSELGWIPSLNYYNSYGWNGQNYPCDYYAANGYCPTPYVFNVGNGQFWNVGNGYTDYLPADYHAPITVAIQESVPNYSPDGQILSYQLQNFYYNAYWDPQAQNYGYYDYKQQFHWLTFPWNNAWNGGI